MPDATVITKNAWDKELLAQAEKVRENAYAPYSHFKVGAAIRTDSGRLYMGCNVENKAYPQGVCAEAGAIAAMVAAGERLICDILVLTDAEPGAAPCGGCRQKIAEFSNANTLVIMASTTGSCWSLRLGELLPHPFELQHKQDSVQPEKPSKAVMKYVNIVGTLLRRQNDV